MEPVSVDEGSHVDALFVGTVFLDIVLAGLAGPPTPGQEVWASSRSVTPGDGEQRRRRRAGWACARPWSRRSATTPARPRLGVALPGAAPRPVLGAPRRRAGDRPERRPQRRGRSQPDQPRRPRPAPGRGDHRRPAVARASFFSLRPHPVGWITLEKRAGRSSRRSGMGRPARLVVRDRVAARRGRRLRGQRGRGLAYTRAFHRPRGAAPPG